MTYSFTVDLHSLHVLGFAHVGAEIARAQFERELDKKDPLHFLHTATLLSVAPQINFASNEYTGTKFAPRSDLALSVLRDAQILSLKPFGSSAREREEIAIRAAEQLERDLLYYSNEARFANVSHRAVTGQGSAEKNATEATQLMMSSYLSADRCFELKEKYFDAPNNTSILMMALRPSFYKLIHEEFWPSLGSSADRQIALNRLDTLFRTYTYYAASAPTGELSWYCPAYDRFTQWEKVFEQMKRGDGASANTESGLGESAVIMGQISSALLKASDGTPRGILRLVTEFREAHGAAINENLPAILQAFEQKKDEEMAERAVTLHTLMGSEFTNLYSKATGNSLEAFLAANGFDVLGGRGATRLKRMPIIKGDIHDQKTRSSLEAEDKFERLGRCMEDGDTRRTFFFGGKAREAMRDKIRKDRRCQELVAAMRGRMRMCLGTGVTIYTTQNEELFTWEGLVKSGLDRVGEQSEQVDFVSSVRELIQRHPTSLSYRFAGDVIRESLSDSEWGSWLKHAFHNVVATDPDLLEAIVALSRSAGLPLITTNYDTLLEKGRQGFSACVPRDADGLKIEDFLNHDDTSYVFHIHGVFDNPDSVVLGNVSYGILAGKKSFSYIKQTFDVPVLFVGFSGFDDPTFARLRSYQQEFRFRSGHFVLLTEAAKERARDTKSLVAPIVYGKSYSDLPIFLHALRDEIST
jgi:hypothetical protein